VDDRLLELGSRSPLVLAMPMWARRRESGRGGSHCRTPQAIAPHGRASHLTVVRDLLEVLLRVRAHLGTLIDSEDNPMTTTSTETDLMVPMRDGVRLATDIYRPEHQDQVPTLLARTPYDKTGIEGLREELDVFAAVRAGYAVVVQDVRGRCASEGDFDAFAQEAADGADTIAWITAQSWSDGNVGTFGKSYLGATQWQLAPAQPPGAAGDGAVDDTLRHL